MNSRLLALPRIGFALLVVVALAFLI